MEHALADAIDQYVHVQSRAGTHQPQEPAVVDLLRQNRPHHLMVKGSEAVGDIGLDEPGCSGPAVRYPQLP